MSNYIEMFITFVVSALIVFFVTPVVRSFAFKHDIVDVPKEERRMHKKPMPKLGGIAIILGFSGAIFINLIFRYIGLTKYFTMTDKMKGFFVAIAIIFVMGILDDVYNLKARYKLIFQILAATVVAASGIRITMITNVFSNEPIVFNTVFSWLITICWIVAMINAINLIDGLDGLAAGITCLSSFFLFIIAIVYRKYDSAVLTIALTGATLGFLPYNFHPAKIFMSDTGSNFLGLALGVIALQDAVKKYVAITMTIPVIVVALPLFDTAFAIIRRMKNGQSIMVADRGHLHHRLVDSGLSHKKSVILLYEINALFGSIAIALNIKERILPITVSVICLIAIIFTCLKYKINIVDKKETEDGKN